MLEEDFLQFPADLTDKYFGGGKEDWSLYSNVNYVLAALILRKLTLQDLASLVYEQVFVPVGMSNSVMTKSDLLDLVAGGGVISHGRRINSDKQIQKLRKHRYLDNITEISSLGIYRHENTQRD